MVPPTVEPLPPYLNFGPLDQASDDLTAAAADYDKAFSAHAASGKTAVNTELIQTEHSVLDSTGLPNRPWFQNMMYAPGFYTGYGVKTLPAVREAMEQKEWVPGRHPDQSHRRRHRTRSHPPKIRHPNPEQQLAPEPQPRGAPCQGCPMSIAASPRLTWEYSLRLPHLLPRKHSPSQEPLKCA